MAAQKLFQQGIDPHRIKSIDVTLWELYTLYPGTNFKGPYERLVQTQASTAFAVSAMLTQGDITYDMGNTLRNDPTILALVAKTTVIPDAIGGALDSHLTVTMEDGTRHEAHASDMPRELIYLNRARTGTVFDARMARLGAKTGAGRALVEQLFDRIEQAGSFGIAEILGQIRGLVA